MESPLIDKILKIEKFPGKGGWTYVLIENIDMSNRTKFGWLQVRGILDETPVEQIKLAPLRKGQLMLVLNAKLRKILKKEEGQNLKVLLFNDNSTLLIPEEILKCVEDYPNALTFFNSMNVSNQQFYIKWINEAINIDTKVERINKMIDRLLLGKKMYDL
jgi:Bacteriocin-protection, YdeI or OmpD-Associated/Domain of unknown function (DUF1905)